MKIHRLPVYESLRCHPVLQLAGLHLLVTWLVALVTLAAWHPRVHPLHERWVRSDVGGEHAVAVEALLRPGRWDAAWYLDIADRGYAAPEMFAFLPLYPGLVGGLAAIGIPRHIGAFLVSAGGMVLAVWMLLRLAGVLGLDGSARRWTAGAFLFFPSAVVLTAGYPEGLLVAAIAATWWAALRGRLVLACAACAAALLIKPLGVVALPLLWAGSASVRRQVAATAAAVAVAGLWPLLLAARGFDLLAPVTAQGHWNREWHAWGPLGALVDALSAAWDGVGAIFGSTTDLTQVPTDTPVHLDAVAVGMHNIVNLLIWLGVAAMIPAIWRRLGWAPAASVGLLLMVPLLAPVAGGEAVDVPLWSMPRFVLAAVPVFVIVGHWCARTRSGGIVVGGISIALFATATAGFAAWQWLGFW